MKKYVSFAIISLLAVLSISLTALAHPGRLDKNGGHYVRTPGHGYPVGSYHYHRGSDRDTAYDASGNVIPKSNSSMPIQTPTPASTPAPTPAPASEPKVSSAQIQTADMGEFYKEFPSIPNYGYEYDILPYSTYNENGVYVYRYAKNFVHLYGLDLIFAGFENIGNSSNESSFLSGNTAVYIEENGGYVNILLSTIDKVDVFDSIYDTALSQISVMVDGTPIAFEEPPHNINDSIMVQISPVVTQIGCSTEWDDATKTLYINAPGVELIKTAQKTENINVYVNNQPVNFTSQQPVNINGYVLIHLRSVMEKLGYSVKWDSNHNIMHIAMEG